MGETAPTKREGIFDMKRILATGAIAAFAMVGFAAPASAAPADAACFGQVHKTVNTAGNVGKLVQELGGQGKNALAKSLC
jgi:hypothetical protein